MKKFIVTVALALGLIAGSQQSASAWVNSRLSIGLNWHYEAAGNSFFWGMWRNGTPGGPDYFHHAPPPTIVVPPPTVVVPGPTLVEPAPTFVVPAPHAYGAPAYVPYTYAPPGSLQSPYTNPAFAGTHSMYGSPFQFSTYPRPTYSPANPGYQR